MLYRGQLFCEGMACSTRADLRALVSSSPHGNPGGCNPCLPSGIYGTEICERGGWMMAERETGLTQIRVASPCRARWDEMEGDERVRFCGHCQKNVYHL